MAETPLSLFSLSRLQSLVSSRIGSTLVLVFVNPSCKASLGTGYLLRSWNRSQTCPVSFNRLTRPVFLRTVFFQGVPFWWWVVWMRRRAWTHFETPSHLSASRNRTWPTCTTRRARPAPSIDSSLKTLLTIFWRQSGRERQRPGSRFRLIQLR